MQELSGMLLPQIILIFVLLVTTFSADQMATPRVTVRLVQPGSTEHPSGVCLTLRPTGILTDPNGHEITDRGLRNILSQDRLDEAGVYTLHIYTLGEPKLSLSTVAKTIRRVKRFATWSRYSILIHVDGLTEGQ
jgi:hypothetical protein